MIGLLSLKADADEAAVITALKARLEPSAEFTALSALVKDGKVIILDTVSALDGRLKKIEEAGTKQIATLSATIGGVVKTFSAEDLVTVLPPRSRRLRPRSPTAKKAISDTAVEAIVKTFSAEGRVPLKEDGARLFRR